MKSNYNLIIPHLKWKESCNFYHLQIIKRRKEHPDLKTNSVTLFQAAIFSMEQLEALMPTIEATCESDNVRCYINLGIKNNETIVHDTIIALAVRLKETRRDITKNYASMTRLQSLLGRLKYDDSLYGEQQNYSAYWSCVGKYKEKGYRLIIDVDDNNTSLKDELVYHIKQAYTKHSQDKAVLFTLPTPNGYHIICDRFDKTLIPQELLCQAEIKENCPTLLCWK